MGSNDVPPAIAYEQYPRAIEIQTISSCNAGCIICPHPDVSQALPTGMMSMELFRRIIDQIEPSWGTRIIPYLNSEPLLDSLIFPRLRYVMERCPDSDVELSTNVSALNPVVQDKLSEVRLRELRLSVFGFTEKTHGSLMPGLRWHQVKRNLDHLVNNGSLRERIGQLSLVMIDHPLVTEEDMRLAKEYCDHHSVSYNFWGFLDRGRNVVRFSNDVYNLAVSGCEQRRPLERMHITFTGQVILCCQDWRWDNTIGNVREDTLLDIWNSEAYNRYRDAIYSGRGAAPELCKRCKLSLRTAI